MGLSFEFFDPVIFNWVARTRAGHDGWNGNAGLSAPALAQHAFEYLAHGGLDLRQSRFELCKVALVGGANQQGL